MAAVAAIVVFTASIAECRTHAARPSAGRTVCYRHMTHVSHAFPRLGHPPTLRRHLDVLPAPTSFAAACQPAVRAAHADASQACSRRTIRDMSCRARQRAAYLLAASHQLPAAAGRGSQTAIHELGTFLFIFKYLHSFRRIFRELARSLRYVCRARQISSPTNPHLLGALQ